MIYRPHDLKAMLDLKEFRVNQKRLNEVIEASLEELIQMSRASGRSGDGLDIYIDVLIAFHKGDAVGLSALSERLSSKGVVRILTMMRLALLRRTITLPLIQEAKDHLPDAGAWKGELSLLIAHGYLAIERFQEAKDGFDLASQELRALGAVGKSLRADLNSVVATSHLFPDGVYVAEYQVIWKKARKDKQWLVAATCLMNLSREHQLLGALSKAVELAGRSIATCHDHPLSENYFLCHAQRAHVLLEMNRDLEALRDLEIVKMSRFPVVIAAYEVLLRLFPRLCSKTVGEVEKRSPVDESAVADGAEECPVSLPEWRTRLETSNLPLATLSAQEEALVQFVAAAPRSKFAICDHLFGTSVHPFAAENRLKNLLGRIRKKCPGLVIYSNELYSVPRSLVASRARSGS